MTTPAEGTATPAPNPTNPPTPPPAAVTAPANPNAAVPQPGAENEPWFKQRLEREADQARRGLLEELGVKDQKRAKEILSAAEKAAEESKSQGERLGEATSKLTSLEKRLAEANETFSALAEERMSKLTDAQRKAVTDAVGDDPQAQLDFIAVVAPTWVAPAQPVAAVATQQPATPPTGTAPPASMPTSTQISPADHKAVHAALLKTNPFAAAQYGLEHMTDVFPDQPSS